MLKISNVRATEYDQTPAQFEEGHHVCDRIVSDSGRASSLALHCWSALGGKAATRHLNILVSQNHA